MFRPTAKHGAASIALCLLCAPAEAEIIHVDIEDFIVDRRSLSLDINADGVDDFLIFKTSGDFGRTITQGLDETRRVITDSPDSPFAAFLTEGDVIGESSPFDQAGWLAEQRCESDGGACAWFGPFTRLNEPGFIGVEFLVDDLSHFGWIRAEASRVSGVATIFEFAFETRPGVSIRAGQIPAPASAWLFVAAALATRRRR